VSYETRQTHLQFIVKAMFCFSSLHVSAPVDHHQALYINKKYTIRSNLVLLYWCNTIQLPFCMVLYLNRGHVDQ